ncbi:hypothetical protein CALCODRAFT_219839 [Calocera cornea HHB12733]|uniref:Uncharacterized protein n=1 Tax=Calocera cornea HHB12733 TaxID=1353952 RepID=A0A165H8P7_9BASI|nr:hypothetical protein CALCODRAFT_219839 [Calocera cornea HHB12733]
MLSRTSQRKLGFGSEWAHARLMGAYYLERWSVRFSIIDVHDVPGRNCSHITRLWIPAKRAVLQARLVKYPPSHVRDGRRKEGAREAHVPCMLRFLRQCRVDFRQVGRGEGGEHVRQIEHDEGAQDERHVGCQMREVQRVPGPDGELVQQRSGGRPGHGGRWWSRARRVWGRKTVRGSI